MNEREKEYVVKGSGSNSERLPFDESISGIAQSLSLVIVYRILDIHFSWTVCFDSSQTLISSKCDFFPFIEYHWMTACTYY